MKKKKKTLNENCQNNNVKEIFIPTCSVCVAIILSMIIKPNELKWKKFGFYEARGSGLLDSEI